MLEEQLAVLRTSVNFLRGGGFLFVSWTITLARSAPRQDEFQRVASTEKVAGKLQAIEDRGSLGVGKVGGPQFNLGKEGLYAYRCSPSLDNLRQFLFAVPLRLLNPSVNGGRIPGQCGGVKAGQFRRGAVVCKKAPDRGPFCKVASATGVRLG